MKQCCGLCPFSRKNTLFLHPERAGDFACMAENPYTDFVCHKTGVVYEDCADDERSGDIVRGEKSLTCAGFHAMQHLANGTESQSEVKVDYAEHFSCADEMIEHHADKWELDNQQN